MLTAPRARSAPSPACNRTRVYPSSVTIKRPKSDKSDFGWRVGEGAGKTTPMMIDRAKAPGWHVSTKQRVRARWLRANSTKAQDMEWPALRTQHLNAASFRRQAPRGPSVVDFIGHAGGLVIEIDGGQHFESKHEQRDARRDAYLAGKGFRVLRYNNYDVMINRQGVLETIAAAIER